MVTTTTMAASSSMFYTGVIRRMCDKYGFVRADQAFGAADYFFLPMTVEPKGTPWSALSEGVRVQFRPTEHDRGLRAEGVRVVLA